MSKHKKRIPLWRQVATKSVSAATFTAIASAVFLTGSQTANAISDSPLPDPSCTTAQCEWLVTEQTDPQLDPSMAQTQYQLDLASQPSETWLELQSAETLNQPASHFRVKLKSPSSHLQINFESGSARFSIAGVTALTASTDPANPFAYDPNLVSDIMVLMPESIPQFGSVASGSPITYPLAFARVTQNFTPEPTVFSLNAATTDAQASGVLTFAEPVTDLQPWDVFAAQDSPGCYVADFSRVSASSGPGFLGATFNVRGCQSSTITLRMRAGSILGLGAITSAVPGPSRDLTTNAFALVGSVADSIAGSAPGAPTPTPTPTQTPTQTPTPSPTDTATVQVSAQPSPTQTPNAELATTAAAPVTEVAPNAQVISDLPMPVKNNPEKSAFEKSLKPIMTRAHPNLAGMQESTSIGEGLSQTEGDRQQGEQQQGDQPQRQQLSVRPDAPGSATENLAKGFGAAAPALIAASLGVVGVTVALRRTNVRRAKPRSLRPHTFQPN